MKYKWMNTEQRELYEELCSVFGFTQLSEVGVFVGAKKNHYHSAKLIFEAKKPNNYLKKILSLKKEDNKTIAKLQKKLEFYESLHNNLDKIKANLQTSLDALSNKEDIL